MGKKDPIVAIPTDEEREFQKLVRDAQKELQAIKDAFRQAETSRKLREILDAPRAMLGNKCSNDRPPFPWGWQ